MDLCRELIDAYELSSYWEDLINNVEAKRSTPINNAEAKWSTHTNSAEAKRPTYINIAEAIRSTHLNSDEAERLTHIKGVIETSYRLAVLFGADPKKAITAALFHDWYRGWRGEELDRLIDYYRIDPRYKGKPNLVHSKLAAGLMGETYGIKDEDTLNAVRYHTTGRAGMSLLEKVVYLADSIEPSRAYEGVNELRDLASYDIDLALKTALQSSINHVREQGIDIDNDTLEAYEALNEILFTEQEE
jgi:predicted HD superfamily hydrolase involved in NAD metabolism